MHNGISSLEELNDAFGAWVAQVANRRIHAETHESPISRYEADGPHRGAAEDKLHEAFLWSVTRRVTKTATVPLEGNSYAVDPALVSRRVELRYDPADLTRIDVFYDGRPAGVATPFVTRRHTHRAVPQTERPPAEATGIDYLALVQKAHEEEAGTEAPIDFSQLQMFERDVTGEALEVQA